MNIIEVEDRWVNVRITMDTGAAKHVMPAGMFLRVKLKRKPSPKMFVAANGEQIRDLGEIIIPSKTNKEIQRCRIFSEVRVL